MIGKFRACLEMDWKEASSLIEKALKEMTNGYYPIKEGSVIIDVETGNVYDVNITVKESKMINGSEIILI